MSELKASCRQCGLPKKMERGLPICKDCVCDNYEFQKTYKNTSKYWNTLTSDKEIADLKAEVADWKYKLAYFTDEDIASPEGVKAGVLKQLENLRGEVAELKKQESTLNKIIDSIKRCDHIKITTDTKVWLELQEKNEKLKAELAKRLPVDEELIADFIFRDENLLDYPTSNIPNRTIEACRKLAHGIAEALRK